MRSPVCVRPPTWRCSPRRLGTPCGAPHVTAVLCPPTGSFDAACNTEVSCVGCRAQHRQQPASIQWSGCCCMSGFERVRRLCLRGAGAPGLGGEPGRQQQARQEVLPRARGIITAPDKAFWRLQYLCILAASQATTCRASLRAATRHNGALWHARHQAEPRHTDRAARQRARPRARMLLDKTRPRCDLSLHAATSPTWWTV